MKPPSQRIRRVFLLSASAVTVGAMVLAGVTSSAGAAQSGPLAGASHSDHRGPGYPPPGGIYTAFTNCPLRNSLMQESVGGSATGCVAGDATGGTITIGNITTPVTHPVTVQFGIWDPPNATPSQFTGGILPPRAGLVAQLVSQPELVPGGLLKALGCPSSDPGVEKLCEKATDRGGRDLEVFAQAQSAGPITNFGLVTWTQPLKFQLINPLLGDDCYIGSEDNPVVLNPSLTGTLVVENDPNPTAHPDTGVLEVTNGAATDTTFAAPGVTGCGPGGSANIAVDEAIDTSAGLPAASGSNSLTLSGTFSLAVCFAPADMARILLSAFKDSVGTPAPSGEAGLRMSAASLRGRFGIR